MYLKTSFWLIFVYYTEFIEKIAVSSDKQPSKNIFHRQENYKFSITEWNHKVNGMCLFCSDPLPFHQKVHEKRLEEATVFNKEPAPIACLEAANIL